MRSAFCCFFFFQAEDGIRDLTVTGVQTCALPISLTIKPNPDPLREDPVAHVNNDCVGCGLCGEVAEAAVLCPSFYRADIVHNARWYDRLAARWRDAAIDWLRRRGDDVPAAAT